MSRSYSIRIPLTRLISADKLKKLGSFSMPFEIMQILPLPRMQEILHKALLDAGCTESEAGLELPGIKSGTAIVNLADRTINIQLMTDGEYHTSVYEEYIVGRINAAGGDIPADLERNPGKYQDRVMDELAQNLSAQLNNTASESIKHQLALKLREAVMAARQEVNKALKDTYHIAIAEKASQIGTVTDISESQAGSVTRIRIEVSV